MKSEKKVFDPPRSFSEVVGALHLHTCYSDGSATFSELISRAKEVGLDYIVVTDHMTLEGKNKGYEGLYDNLTVIIGYEHNDNNKKNHYLAIGTDKVIIEQDSPQAYIDLIKSAKGIGFLAHPAEERQFFKKYPSYPWTAWEVSGFDGIEVWNHLSEWVENLKNWRSFIRIFYPRRFLKGIPPGLLKKWDELNNHRFISGIGGVDAHTFKYRLGFLQYQIFPLKVELKGIRTHLYVPHEKSDKRFNDRKKTYLHALKNGNGYISNFRRGDARGAQMYLCYADNTIVPPGYTKKKSVLPALLHVSVPQKSDIRIVRNGKLVQSKTCFQHQFDITENGLYRIEVYRKNKAWIYSNPFPIGSYPLY